MRVYAGSVVALLRVIITSLMILSGSITATKATGGDTQETAIAIPGYEWSDYGNTTGFTDDYYEICDQPGTGAPDVVYSFTPPYCSYSVWFDLCNSAYDTKLYIYENTISSETLLVCNDDECVFQSYVWGVHLSEFKTYYIVIDGFGDHSGDYEFEMGHSFEWGGCLDCPDGGVDEVEQVDHPTGWVDIYNGGCDTDPGNPILQTLEGDETGEYILCGRLFRYDTPQGENVDDADWYRIFAGENGNISFTVRSAVPANMSVVSPDCEETEPIYHALTEAYVPESIEFALPPGTEIWLRVSAPGTHFFGDAYNLWLEGIGVGSVSPVESSSWGMVKKNFR
jgi:hypothetical protein